MTSCSHMVTGTTPPRHCSLLARSVSPPTLPCMFWVLRFKTLWFSLESNQKPRFTVQQPLPICSDRLTSLFQSLLSFLDLKSQRRLEPPTSCTTARMRPAAEQQPSDFLFLKRIHAVCSFFWKCATLKSFLFSHNNFTIKTHFKY